MRTKKGLFISLALVLLLAFTMSACVAPAPEVVVEEPVVAQEEASEPVLQEEPVAEAEEMVVEEVAFTEADLDASVESFLAGMESYNTITPAALNEAMIEGEIFLIDVREPAELEEKGYIEGAVNIPIRELGANVDKLPALDTPIVVYCAAGTRATLGMVALGELGYTNVKALVGNSFGGWVEAGFPAAEGTPPAPEVLDAVEFNPGLVEAVDMYLSGLPEGFAQIDSPTLNEELIDSDLVLIDVRKPGELEANGAIEGAVNVTLEDMVALKNLWPDLDANIVVYCAKGTRGNIAMAILRTYGYENVRNLKGGFTAWADAGLPAVGGMNNLVAQFLGGMEGYNFITPPALNEAMIEGDVFLIDVRSPAELEENGYIEGAVNIQLDTLAQNVDKLPAFDTPIVTYCAKGTRATIAMVALGELGFTHVKALVGDSFGGWVAEGYPVAEGLPAEPEVLNAVEPNAAMLAAVDTMLTTWPEGYAQVDAATLNEELIEGGEIILIDVRRAEEVAEAGIIEGAVNIPLEELIARRAEWPATDATVVIYCKAGSRGNIALSILRTFGYTDVRNLKGGFGGWVDAGYPVVTDSVPVAPA